MVERQTSAVLSDRELSRLRYRQQEEVDALLAIFGSKTIFSCPRPTDVDGTGAGTWDEGLPEANITVLTGARGSGELRLRIDLGPSGDAAWGIPEAGGEGVSVEEGGPLVRACVLRLPPAYPDFAPPEVLELHGPERLPQPEALRVRERLSVDVAAFLAVGECSDDEEAIYQLIEYLHGYTYQRTDSSGGEAVQAGSSDNTGSSDVSGARAMLDCSTHPLFSGDALLGVLLLLDAESACRCFSVCSAWAVHGTNEQLFEQLCRGIYPGQSSRYLACSREPRAISSSTALPLTTLAPEASWRGMLLTLPRVRTTGIYCIKWAALKPVCRDMFQAANLPADHINETVIYRYIRFCADGRLQYLMASGWDLPALKVAEIFHTESMMARGGASPGAGAHSANRTKQKSSVKHSVAAGVYSVGEGGNIEARVSEAHATILFRFQLKSTRAGANDRLAWRGHALMDKDAHLAPAARQAELHRVVFEVPATADWKFVSMSRLFAGNR
jgi:hypothetical protein